MAKVIDMKKGKAKVDAKNGKKKKRKANNLDGCTVEPLRTLEDVKAIERLLADRPRDLLLFTLGINVGLRVKDLLELKVHHLLDKPVNAEVNLTESKTDKKNFFVINTKIHKVFNKQYMPAFNPDADDWLFKSHRSQNHLTSSAVGKKIKRWCKDIGLEQERYGAHTLRKSWGFINRKFRGVDISLLQERYGHSSSKITLRYMCITRKEVAEILQNPI